MITTDWNQRSQDHWWGQVYPNGAAPTRAEFDELKREIQELKKLLKAAKMYDTVTGQPDCELEDKVALVKKLAELVGVDLEDVFA
jgi:hypothetical protein